MTSSQNVHKRIEEKITLKRIYNILQSKTMHARIRLEQSKKEDFEFYCGYWLMGDLAVRLIEIVLKAEGK